MRKQPGGELHVAYLKAICNPNAHNGGLEQSSAQLPLLGARPPCTVLVTICFNIIEFTGSSSVKRVAKSYLLGGRGAGCWRRG